MSGEATRRKWDRASRTFDRLNGLGPEWRWGPAKRELFGRMRGRVIFVAVGTGLDIRFFPPEQEIVGLDISPKMLEKAAPRAAAYPGSMTLELADVEALEHEPESFDMAFTSCTFCSVPDPVRGLESLRRVLRPGGELHMFEHTGSRWFPYSLMLRAMTPISRRFGPELDRDTPANVERAGFADVRVRNVFLDVVRTIHAVAPG